MVDKSYLNGVLPLGKVDLPLPLLLGLLVGLVLGHAAAESTGVLGPEVEREVLLVLVEQTELRALVEVDDSEDTSDRLADVLAVGGVSIIFIFIFNPSILVKKKFFFIQPIPMP